LTRLPELTSLESRFYQYVSILLYRWTSKEKKEVCHLNPVWLALFSRPENTWFINNRLSLNFNKTQFLEFRTNHYSNDITQSAYDLKGITNATEARFLGLTLYNTLSWKKHIQQVVTKMCSACYALRNINK